MAYTTPIAIIVALSATSIVAADAAQAAPRNEIEITYYRTAAKDRVVGSRLLSCSGRVYRQGRTSRHQDRIVTPCQSSTPLPDDPTVPCDFKAQGCGPFGRR